MRTVIQRVTYASVFINDTEKAAIRQGILVFVGIEDDDSIQDVEWLSGKICRLRIFSDERGLMNLSVADIQGSILVISQFTLHASTKKGNRPSFIKAAKPDTAKPLYESLISRLQSESGVHIECGEFGADMKIHLLNDGPVTIIMDSKNKE